MVEVAEVDKKAEIAFRCPACKVRLGMNVPAAVMESALQQVRMEMAQDQSKLWGIDTEPYKQEVARVELLTLDVAEFLSEPLELAKEKQVSIEPEMAQKWREHRDNHGSVDDWYISNSDYLYDIAKYNSFESYQQTRLLPLAGWRNAKIVDIGCGLGTLTFMLAAQGNQVIGYDISPLLIDFCNYKKQKYELGGEFTTEWPDMSEVNLVTATGVLEHIEDLRAFLLKLGKSLKRGAKLYHYDDWYDQIISPMHFDHSLQVDGWLQEAGLAPWSDKWAVRV